MRKFYNFISVLFFVGSLTAKALPSNTIPSGNFVKDPSFISESLLSPDTEEKFVIYVNDGILYIKYDKPQDLYNAEAVVYNLLGQEITRKKLENSNINQINIPFQNTCYIIKISYSGKVHTQKVLVTNQ